MITDQAIVHVMKKTNRNASQANHFLQTLKDRADKANKWVTKHPSNSEWETVLSYRDPKTGHTIWCVNGNVVNIVFGTPRMKREIPEEQLSGDSSVSD